MSILIWTTEGTLRGTATPDHKDLGSNNENVNDINLLLPHSSILFINLRSVKWFQVLQSYTNNSI